MNKMGCYSRYIFIFSFLCLLFIVIATGNEKFVVTTYNVNNVKSIQAGSLSSLENNNLTIEQPIVYSSLEEATTYVGDKEVSFVGKLTGYGPDCVGCTGNVACSPGQNVENGNIYFQDEEYGKIRIVAADKKIPCGSIIRIHGISIYSEPIIAIVMDRGGSIKGEHLDLLFETQTNMNGFHTQNNLQFDIVRWGF